MNAFNFDRDFPRPLRLATGSHQKGTGAGCAMNLISYENGDTEITDMPGCADPFLARVVQRVNDTYCTHGETREDGVTLLCPACSVKVLELAHRTVGTALDLSTADRARVYVELAVEQAESVLHLTSDERPRAACALVRRFLAGEAVTGAALRIDAAATYAAAAAANDAAAAAATYAAADDAAYAAAATYAAAANATYAAEAAAEAAANAAADDAAYAAAANDAAANDAAAAATYAANDRLARAHHIIDRFEAITGIKAEPVVAEVTEAAVAAMRA